VVNYELPNVPEDYVHRIGRTGRAGKEGQAVNLVCLDEEGFMAEIERFTKQQIPVVPVEGYGPEPGERAEPIAMGRQTIWGGAGKPPSREVMAAAAKAARSEMMQRIRDNKAAQGERGKGGGQGQPRAQGQGKPQGAKSQGPGRSSEQRRGGGGNGPRGNSGGNAGQPDPLRTGTDALSQGGRRRGGRGRSGGGQGGGKGGGGGVDPLRTSYGRISH
jgi:ATP-dependent RNA helicase RhlE